MNSYFTADFFTQNRKRLRQLAKTDAPIVIAANGLLQQGADSTYAFSQDASFWYLTGIDDPDLILVMDEEDEYFIVPERDANRQAFDGVISNDMLRNRSGVATVYVGDAGWAKLHEHLSAKLQMATLAAAPAYIEHYGMYTNPARAHMLAKIQQQNPTVELIELSVILSGMRMIKQKPEIQAIQKAISITATAIKDAVKPQKLQKYDYEYEIEAELSRGFRKRGATGHAFEPIVANGERACTLHNVANNGLLNKQELTVIDVGAEVEHYAADITRTVSIAQPSKRQKSVHEAVLDVQQYAFSLLRPGVLLKEYEQKIEQYMGEKLIALELIFENTHDNVRAYYPHSTSHFLGLNVHDTGLYDQPLQKGTVLTVEPGIYITDENIGIRIEDDVLITKDGIKVLSEKLSRAL
jgi:Xaa-Pro aminopeptidase